MKIEQKESEVSFEMQKELTLKKVREINDLFNDRLKLLLTGNKQNFSHLDIGYPSGCLLECSLPNLPIEVSVRVVKGKANQSNHPFKISDITHLPDSVCNPIAVFRSATSMDDTKVILTDLEANGVNIIVVIKPNCSYARKIVNDIRSIYPKDNIKAILEWICIYNLMEYYDKQKILNWLSKHQYNADEVTKLIKESTNLVNKN